LSTEHGPKGGDEININHNPILKIKNFGWPISSYGEHYAKHYSKKILSEFNQGYPEFLQAMLGVIWQLIACRIHYSHWY